jgi:integrase
MRGSIVQKPPGSGRWYVVVEMDRDPGTGARRRKWHSGFSSKRDAERGLTRILTSLDQGSYLSPTRVTVASYLTQTWLPAIEPTVRPTTFNGYRAHINLYVVPQLGAEQLQRLTPDQLSHFYRDLHKQGGRDGGPLSANTVRRVHATLHRALRDGVRWGYLQRNPAQMAVKPRQPNVGTSGATTWTAAEVKTFLRAVNGKRLQALWRVAVTTGLRRGELLGLRWVDVDLMGRRLAVRQTLTSVGSQVIFGEPKTKRGKRSVALDGQTVDEIAAWRQLQQAERASWGKAWQSSGLVFTREDGSLIHPDLLSKWFVRYSRGSGLTPIRFHDLRHTHASLALQAGVPAKIVSERLGHATVAFTLDVYSHVIPGLQEEAAERIAALTD